jgi:MFS family permease
VASWIAGTRLVPRYGPRLMLAGLAILAAGLLGAIAAYHANDPTTYPWTLLVALAISGLGFGSFTVPFFTAALARVQPQETGSAAGLLNAVQQLGATLGIAVLGSVFLHTLTTNPPQAAPATAHTAVQRAFRLALALLAVATASAALMTTRPRQQLPTTDHLPGEDDVQAHAVTSSSREVSSM